MPNQFSEKDLKTAIIKNLKDAFEISKYVADKGYTVLTNGLNVSIQNEGLKVAKASYYCRCNRRNK